ncbi:lung adenoma susceptibility protein 2 [Spea bombifrons]|uniref:lung adenoma susceptibility protein 2 n=1 Tax=Spea bombifrons TaxID=233779 RepID=UPI00234ABE19|nr:lung adenoma susceptibility protein 2 [Spea bombifrons]XP_053304182.1 lung adenoma susceptibility protein 2 [Spea bombifrons]
MARSGSPDSSVSISSLLASCSLGSSSTRTSFPSIVYKDRLYDSASRALEAYIEDYEQNLRSPVSSGKITLTASSRLPPATRRAGSPVKGERVTSLRRRTPRDPDLLSLTTDDLLGFPSDGSLPAPRARLSEHKHASARRKHNGSSSRMPAPLTSRPASSLNGTSKLSLLDLQTQDYPDVFKEKRKPRYIPYATGSENKLVFNNKNPSKYSLKNSALPKSYPRWLTSEKSELSVSGLTSIPDVKYPVWLNALNLPSDSDSDAISKEYRSLETVRQPRIAKKVHSAPFTGRMTDLRVPQLGAYGDREGFDKVIPDNIINEKVATNPGAYKHLERLLRDDSVEVVLQSSKSPNNFGKKDLAIPVPNGSPRTEDILEGERSWEKLPFAIKSPVLVLCEEEDRGLGKSSGSNPEAFLSDCMKKKDLAPGSTFSGGHHHGPVEALKHMLFNLQSFQQHFNEGTNTEQGKEVNGIHKEGNSGKSHLEQEAFPVNKSLQKAMHHLSRLKELVGDSNVRQDKENNQEP